MSSYNNSWKKLPNHMAVSAVAVAVEQQRNGVSVGGRVLERHMVHRTTKIMVVSASTMWKSRVFFSACCLCFLLERFFFCVELLGFV